MPEYVTLKEFSERIKMDRSQTRKWLIREGFSMVSIRDMVSRQTVNALTAEDASLAFDRRQKQGFTHQDNRPPVLLADDNNGVFYVIKLMPDLAPNRIKVGFASSLQPRLDAHRTTCPSLDLVKHWSCRRVFEPAAIAAAVNGTSMLYGGEVYDAESVEDVVSRLDAFFSLVNH